VQTQGEAGSGFAGEADGQQARRRQPPEGRDVACANRRASGAAKASAGAAQGRLTRGWSTTHLFGRIAARDPAEEFFEIRWFVVVRGNSGHEDSVTCKHFADAKRDIRQPIPKEIAAKLKKCGLAATESRQKPTKARPKSYFLSTNYRTLLIMKMFELIRTQRREGLQWLRQR